MCWILFIRGSLAIPEFERELNVLNPALEGEFSQLAIPGSCAEYVAELRGDASEQAK